MLDGVKKSRILSAMVLKKEEATKKVASNYKCHSVSPYGDGYGDHQYGDRSD